MICIIHYFHIMDQDNLFLEPNTSIRQDLSTFPFVRYYLQEDSFQQSYRQKGKLKVELPFNQIVNQIVSQLNLMSKHIANNSRLTSSFLQNGKDISIKKRQYFEQFCSQYPIINETIVKLSPPLKAVFEYSVMTLSNLILKLSINMAKISIVVVTKLLIPPFINIFTVAILFEKYLEYRMVRNKENFKNIEDRRNFIKQFPKISIVKLQNKRNAYDIKLIEKCQRLFNNKKQHQQTNESPFEAQNIQLIQFYNEQSIQSHQQKQDSKYPQYESYNLNTNFGLRPPYSFELYLFINEIVINKMIDFKPDIIIYIEDFDNDIIPIDPRIRGLIINQFSSKVQNKIYVFKEFGITSDMKSQKIEENGEQQLSEQQISFYSMKNQIVINKSQFDRYMEQNQKITHQIFQYLYKQQKKQFLGQSIIAFEMKNQKKQKSCEVCSSRKEPKRLFLGQSKKKSGQKLCVGCQNGLATKLSTMHKILLDDLTYLSLALIQKSNFEDIIKQFENYIFPNKFLERMISWMEKQKKLIQQHKMYTQAADFLQSCIEKITDMKQISTYTEKAQSNNTQFKIFNFLQRRQEILIDQNLQSISISKSDSLYVAYVQEYTILIIFRQQEYIIYRKVKNQKHYNFVRRQENIGDNRFLFKKNSSFVANDNYIYKAFGELSNYEDDTESSIYRFCIKKPLELEWQKWELVNKQCIFLTKEQNQLVNQKIKIPLEFKRFGFGISYKIIQNKQPVNITLFGGGYNFKTQNQQRVNRSFYLIKDRSDQIFKVGKTNGKLINEIDNLRNKMVIYPFVYGIPFLTNENEIALINTNGYLENINHFKKIFLTRINLGPISSTNIGIFNQNRLQNSKKSPEMVIADKNTILSYMINSYNKINRFGNEVSLYDGEERTYIMKFLPKSKEYLFDRLTVEPTSDMNQQDILCLNFDNVNFSKP